MKKSAPAPLKRAPKQKPYLVAVIVAAAAVGFVSLDSKASIEPVTPGAFVELNLQLAGFPQGTRIEQARVITERSPTRNPLCRFSNDEQAPRAIDVAYLEGGVFHLYGGYARGGFCKARIASVRFEIVAQNGSSESLRLPVEIVREGRAPAAALGTSLDDIRVRCGRSAAGPVDCEAVTDSDSLNRKRMQATIPDPSRSPVMRVQRLRIELSDTSGS